MLGRDSGGVVVVYVGWAACDFVPVQEGLVQTLYAPAGSPLAELCDEAGVRYRSFAGWDAVLSDITRIDN